MDPVLTALGIVAEGVAAELAQQLVRHRRPGRRDEVTPTKAGRLLKDAAKRLEHVSIRGLPRPEEIAALAKLPQLARLTVHGVGTDTASDADALHGLHQTLPHVAVDLVYS